MEVDEATTSGRQQTTRGVARKGSFVGCTARFDGSRDNLNKFLVSVCLYKDVERVNEEVALRELPLLFEGEAAEWWGRVGAGASKWSDAMAMLQEAYAPRRAAYEIYADLFSTKQEASVATDEFVKRKRALLAELAEPHSEEAQIDMIYWMLRKQVRRRMPRKAIISLDDMAEKGRYVDNMEKRRATLGKRWDEETVAKYFARSVAKCPHHKRDKEKYLHERNEERCNKCNKRKHGRYKSATISIERLALCKLDSNTLERFAASCTLAESGKDNASSSSSCHQPSPPS